MNTFGFIGTGNMGGALAKAVSKKIDPKNIVLSNRTKEKALELSKETGCMVGDNNAAYSSDYVFMGVKPAMLAECIKSLEEARNFNHTPVIISMAAGTSIASIEKMVNRECPIIRIMPNTPVAVGEGVILYCKNSLVSDEETKVFLDALFYAGKCIEIDEKLIDAGCALSGCGPAFVQMFIEGLSDGGVYAGLPRNIATELAARTLLGSAKLLLESGKNPIELKDAVCSPGGTTIAGVRVLESMGFEGMAMDAVIASYEKTLG